MARFISLTLVVATVMLGLLSSIALTLNSLDNCAKQMEFHCATEAVGSVFQSGPVVSSECCAQMVKMGKFCHDNFVKDMASKPDFINKKSEYLTKGQKTWEHCASIAKGGASPAPSA